MFPLSKMENIRWAMWAPTTYKWSVNPYNWPKINGFHWDEKKNGCTSDVPDGQSEVPILHGFHVEA